MHRSITFTEMLSSTFSNDRYDDAKDKNSKKLFIARIGIGSIEFLTSTIFLSFGILFSSNIRSFTYDVETGLWTTIILISSWHLTGPCSRTFCDYMRQKGEHVFKYLICLSTVFLFCGLLMPGNIFCYGIFGGIFTNVINTQLKVVALKMFDTKLKIFEANLQCGKALGLLIMPHMLLALLSNYTTEQAKLIFSAILLNIIPAVWIIRPPKAKEAPNNPEFSRYKTLPALSLQMKEMMDFTNNEFTSDVDYADSSEDEDEDSPVEPETPNQPENLSFNEDQVPQLPQVWPLNSRNVKDYFSKAGVAILPEIPEEIEENQEETENTDFIDPKRISRISAKLEELNQIHNGFEILNISDLVVTKTNVENVEKIQNIEYIPNYKENNNKFLKDMETVKIQSCCTCPTYKIFLWKRKFRILKDFIMDNLFKPLWNTLKEPHFYPIILSKVSMNLISMMFITLAPYLALQKNDDFRNEDTAFLLSYIAFSWCLFLVLLPLVVTFNKKKLSGLYVSGLLLCAFSLLLLFKEKVSNDFITLSCLLYGFGNGIVNYTEEFIYRNYMGIRRWQPMENTLDTLFSLLVILVYYLIYMYQIDIIVNFPIIAFVVYSVNAFVWGALPILSSLLVLKRSYTLSDLDASQSLQID